MNMVSEMGEGTALDDGIARFLGVSGDEGEIRLSDIRNKAAIELKKYGEDLGALLLQHEITVPPAIQLVGTDDGRIAVQGEHPAKERIEGVINGDTRLLKWFKEIEVLFEILRRTELRGAADPVPPQYFNLGLTSLGSIAFFSAR
ncbi:hypothetical protein GCM10007860_15600 [Chitiniphilus shinanonensis]|uniref:Carrier domain-containing protein n=1 Tax=Chitiniphilus shinanonensis TaxID=553088 RepID=A0ABQ6BWW8_9NEIS|nr:hypothetical protein [Chitiniphilus shinanonensis]GLS04413.1 hypothetical protein GCM10007860_15600 [Chitiniphilus shinanonensis]